MTNSLQEAKEEYEAAKEETNLHQMYEGLSTKTGGKVYQKEVFAARHYISELERSHD